MLVIQEGILVNKSWDEAKPFNYSEVDIVTDYVNGCNVLTQVMNIWKELKDYNTMIYKKIVNGEPFPEG